MYILSVPVVCDVVWEDEGTCDPIACDVGREDGGTCDPVVWDNRMTHNT